MDLGLTGKTVVVTGGSKGIGYAAAEAFLKEGARVAICSRHEEELKKAAETLSQYGPVYYEAYDVVDAESNYRFAEHVNEKFGSLDVWVNNVGVSGPKKGDEYDDEEIDFMTGVCFKSVVYGCQAAFRYMKKQRSHRQCKLPCRALPLCRPQHFIRTFKICHQQPDQHLCRRILSVQCTCHLHHARFYPDTGSEADHQPGRAEHEHPGHPAAQGSHAGRNRAAHRLPCQQRSKLYDGCHH